MCTVVNVMKYSTQSTEQKAKGVFEKLINAGANVNACNVDGRTPLYFAVLRHNFTAVAELAKCSDINIQVFVILKTV